MNDTGIECAGISSVIERLQDLQKEYGEIAVMTCHTQNGLPTPGMTFRGVINVVLSTDPKKPEQRPMAIIVTKEGNEVETGEVYGVKVPIVG